MNAFSIARLVVFCVSLICAIVVLSLSAHLTSESINVLLVRQVPAFEAFGIVVGLLTILSLTAMLLIGMLRDGAFTSMIVVEVAWLSFLWIMWLANASLSTSGVAFNFPLGCVSYIPYYQGLCSEVTAVQGLSFLTWLLLKGYSLTVLISALIASSRGNRVWKSSVGEANFFKRQGGLTIEQPPKVEPANAAYQYPPNQGTPAPYNPAGGFAPSRNNGYPQV